MKCKRYISPNSNLHQHQHNSVKGAGNVWKRRMSLVKYASLFISIFVISARIDNSNKRSADSSQDSVFQVLRGGNDINLHISCWVIALVCQHIILRCPSDNHTFLSLIRQYVITSIIQLLGWIGAYYFQKGYTNCKTTQEQLLKYILSRQAKTQYGRDFAFTQLDSVEKFRKGHPLTTYKHYEKYFQACIAGQTDVIIPGKTDFICTTSGTTSGASKEFPRNRKYLLRCYMMSFLTCLYIPFYRELKQLQTWPQIFIKPHLKRNAFGTLRGPLSSLFRRMPHSTSPAAAYNIPCQQSMLYVHAIFALKDPSPRAIFLQIAPIALVFFKMVENNWEKLCYDIESGTIDKDIEMPEEIRIELEGCLTPDVARADELRAIFIDGVRDMIPRVWPNCTKLTTLSSASYATQSNIIKNEYAGNIPIVSNIHMATEAVYGIQATEFQTSDDFEYVFLVNSNFFEFIHFDKISEDQPPTHLAHELVVGERYEIVVTTCEGLYRYRTQDIIKVTGYQGTTARYVLLHRTGDVLNMRSEKVHEEMISRALHHTVTTFNMGKIIDYTSTENINIEQVQDNVSGQLYYVIFVELWNDTKLPEELKYKIDEILMELVDNYRSNRLSKSVQSARLYQVHVGTFDKLRQLIMDSNPDANLCQYKTPKITRNSKLLGFLLENLVK